MRAQEERNAALAKLEEVKGVVSARTRRSSHSGAGRREAEEERARIERTTEEDVRKLREQARRESKK